MGEVLEGDLHGTVVWGADLSGSLLRDVDLTGVRISHALVVDVEIDAIVERLVVNGVDVTAYVAERDPWRHLRSAQRASSADEVRVAWDRLQAGWRALLERARALPDGTFERSVGGEWSLVETLRHLVFALDKWWAAPVLGRPFSSVGLPDEWSRRFPWPGLAVDHPAPVGEVLQASREQAAAFTAFARVLLDEQLDAIVTVRQSGQHTVRQCVQTIFEELFWHLRYADRDLRVLESA